MHRGRSGLRFYHCAQRGLARSQGQQPFVELGRATMPNASDGGILADKIERQSKKFAETNYALRLMEAVGVCIVQNEPTLLVGETGCGKTVSVGRRMFMCCAGNCCSRFLRAFLTLF